jgi:hypothetical protein
VGMHARVQIFFVSLPGRFITAILYVLPSKLYQKKVYETSLTRVKGTK